MVALVVAASACQPPAPRPDDSRLGQCDPGPFSEAAVIAFDPTNAHHLSVAVYDDRTDCWYFARRDQRVTTASVVKVQIMAGVLLRAQSAGRMLTRRESALVSPMIHHSDNAPASSLWSELGASRGMRLVGAAFGMNATREVTPKWGLTVTSAEDQARFLHQLVQGPGPLQAPYRGVAWAYLRNIRADQRWGVSAGVPAGWAVGQKNGFATSTDRGWRLNSVGYVADPAGGGYSVAILSDGWPNQPAGVPTLDAVGRLISAAFAR